MSVLDDDKRTSVGLDFLLEIAPVLDQVMKRHGFESKDDQTVVMAAFMSAFTGYMLRRVGQEHAQMVLASIGEASKRPRLQVVKP